MEAPCLCLFQRDSVLETPCQRAYLTVLLCLHVQNFRLQSFGIQRYRTRSEDDAIEDLINVDKVRDREEEITSEAKTWLFIIACTQPKDY